MLIGNVENLDNYKQKIVEQKNKIVETQPINITNNQNQEINPYFNLKLCLEIAPNCLSDTLIKDIIFLSDTFWYKF